MGGLRPSNPASELARSLVRALRDSLGDRVANFTISDVRHDDAGRMGFSVRFEMYDYFPMIFNFDRGTFGFAIRAGDTAITVLSGPDGSYSLDDVGGLAAALDHQVRLRIPDKFLHARGW